MSEHVATPTVGSDLFSYVTGAQFLGSCRYDQI